MDKAKKTSVCGGFMAIYDAMRDAFGRVCDDDGVKHTSKCSGLVIQPPTSMEELGRVCRDKELIPDMLIRLPGAVDMGTLIDIIVVNVIKSDRTLAHREVTTKQGYMAKE